LAMSRRGAPREFSFAAALVARQPVFGQFVVVARLGHVPVARHAQAGKTVERPHGNADCRSSEGIPNKLEPYSAQKPRRARASPSGLWIQRSPRCSNSTRSSLRGAGRRRQVAVPLVALFERADQDIARRAANLVPDGPVQTSPS